VISPRSACSRKITQMCWSASSTVSTVIKVLTSTQGLPARMHSRGRGFGPHCGVTLLPHEDQLEPELRFRPCRAYRPTAHHWHAAVTDAITLTDWDTRDQRESLTWAYCLGAGDENRTRTISLGICPVGAAKPPDLGGGVSTNDRPLITGINGPLMARRCPVAEVWPCHPWRWGEPIQVVAWWYFCPAARRFPCQ
jgi:hypothetical protein